MRILVCSSILALLGMYLLPVRVESQDMESIFPRDFTERDLFREMTILNPKSAVHRIFKSEPVAVVEIFRFRVEVLHSEIENMRKIRDRLQKQQHEVEAMIAAIQDQIEALRQKAETATEMSLVDQDTVNMLVRNCLVELQRLQWEIASEKSMSEQQNAKPDSRIVEAQLESHRALVGTRRQQVNELMKQLEQAKKELHDKGARSSIELSKMTVEVEVGKAKLAIAEQELAFEQAKLEALVVPRVSDSVMKLVQLKARLKAVTEQIERLGNQRQIQNEISILQSKMKRLQEQLGPIARRLVEQELAMNDRELMVENMERVIERVDAEADGEKKANGAK